MDKKYTTLVLTRETRDKLREIQNNNGLSGLDKTINFLINSYNKMVY